MNNNIWAIKLIHRRELNSIGRSFIHIKFKFGFLIQSIIALFSLSFFSSLSFL